MADRPRVVIVGLGPGGTDLLTAGTLVAIDAAPVRFLRTSRHPAAAAVADATTFDDVYEGAESIDDVYPAIVERLVAAAGEHGRPANGSGYAGYKPRWANGLSIQYAFPDIWNLRQWSNRM